MAKKERNVSQDSKKTQGENVYLFTTDYGKSLKMPIGMPALYTKLEPTVIVIS